MVTNFAMDIYGYSMTSYAWLQHAGYTRVVINPKKCSDIQGRRQEKSLRGANARK
jgi:hypothetical protein